MTNAELWTPSKRDVLLFDQIALGGLEKAISNTQDLAVRADLEFLASKEILVDYRYQMSGRTGALTIDGKAVANLSLDDGPGKAVEHQAAVCGLVALSAYLKTAGPPDEAAMMLLTDRLNVGAELDKWALAESAASLMRELSASSPGPITPEYIMDTTGPLMRRASIRSTVAVLDTTAAFTATPLIPYPTSEHLLLGAATVSDVNALVLHSLPVPDDLTPWEAILDFRSDSNSREQLSRLGRWSRAAAGRILREEVTVQALDDELASMLADYREHMRVHKMKVGTSVFETILTLVGEISEDLIKLRFKALATALFRFRHDRVALMEAELKAPGRQVAYIVSAQNRFGTSPPPS